MLRYVALRRGLASVLWRRHQSLLTRSLPLLPSSTPLTCPLLIARRTTAGDATTHSGGGGSSSSSSSASSGSGGGGGGASKSSAASGGGGASAPAAAAAAKKMKKKKKKTMKSEKKKATHTAAAAAASAAKKATTAAGSGSGASSSSSGSSHTSNNSSGSGSTGGHGGGSAASSGQASSPSSASSGSSAAQSKAKAKTSGKKKKKPLARPAKRTRKQTDRKRKKKTTKSTSSSSSSSGSGSAASALVPTPASAVRRRKTPGSARRRGNRLRVCVINSSYEGTNSPTANVDNFWCTPQHYIKKGKKRYTFADASIKKIESYRRLRELVTSDNYDVFFNLCDGGRDEERAGVDVVQALEDMNAAFTGTDSHSFEPSKIDMKLLVGSSGVRVPNFVLLYGPESLAKKCRHLRFPVIVKHLSGYASVGINKDNRCNSLDELKHKLKGFIKEFNHALVEEFIRGREGTVLVCADSHSPFGIKVFRPLMFNFLQNADDFAYFEKKWTMECNEKAYGFLPAEDPAYTAITDMARNAFKYIMNGVGYGRVDFRIDERTGQPHFLEINPNCGMWYSEKDGGDFADVMVNGDPTWDHERFFQNAITRALKEQAARKPWYFISHDKNGNFSTRATRTVPEGKQLFDDAVHPVPVIAQSLHKLGEAEPSVGCVIKRGDGIDRAVAIRHSCEPNMQFVHGRTLTFAAKRQINTGEELTVDYGTLRDETMPHFACSCGTKNCRSVIIPMPAMPRTVEAKTARKMLRERKRKWRQEELDKADKVAEKLIRKRTESGSSSKPSATK